MLGQKQCNALLVYLDIIYKEERRFCITGIVTQMILIAIIVKLLVLLLEKNTLYVFN